MRDEGFPAGIARRFRNRFHFAADARHFAEAELMDLVRAHVRGRHLADTERIIVGTAGLGGHADRLRTGRGVIAYIPVALLGQRRVDLCLDHCCRLTAQFGKIGFADGGGARPGERLVETALGRIFGGEACDRAFEALQGDARLRIAAGNRLIGDGDRLRVDGGKLRQPVNIAAVIRFGAERQVVGHPRKILMPAGIAGEIDHTLTEAIAFDLLA